MSDQFLISVISGLFWLCAVLSVLRFMGKQREANRQMVALLEHIARNTGSIVPREPGDDDAPRGASPAGAPVLLPFKSEKVRAPGERIPFPVAVVLVLALLAIAGILVAKFVTGTQ